MVADHFGGHVIANALEGVVIEDIVDTQQSAQIAESAAVPVSAPADRAKIIEINRILYSWLFLTAPIVRNISFFKWQKQFLLFRISNFHIFNRAQSFFIPAYIPPLAHLCAHL